MPGASETSPQTRGGPSASIRTSWSRTGSPTTRMTVARSSAEAGGWGIFSSSAVGAGMPLWYNFESSMILEIWKRKPMRVRPRRPRAALSRPVAYALAAAVIFMSLFASGSPSPLYGTYSALWHFSPIVLTVVYATYAFGVLASLLLAGRLSDDVGRRPVLVGAIGALMVSTGLFMFADSVVWLFVARGLQGIATGASLSAASAALLDLHPRRDTAGVSLTNGVASTAGIGLGVLVSAALVELAPAPRVLPYAAELVLLAIAFAGALPM